MSRTACLRASLSSLAVLAALLVLPAPALAALGFLDQFGAPGAGPGQLDDPRGIDVAPNGDVYVADTGNDRIQVFDRDGNFVRQWSTFDGGAGHLEAPAAVSVDSVGVVAVADSGNDTLHRFNADGTEELVPPLGTDSYENPSGTDALSGQTFFNADTNHHRLVTVVTGKMTIVGKAGTGVGEFAYPRGLELSSGRKLYVADTNNDRIQRFSISGEFELQFGTGGLLNDPHDVAIDATGRVYVADTLNNRIQRFTAGGAPLGAFGGPGGGPGQFSQPRGIATDCHGNVYVADTVNDRIQKLGEPGNAKPPCTGSGPQPDPDPDPIPIPGAGGGAGQVSAPPADLINASAPKVRILGRKVSRRGAVLLVRLRCATPEPAGACRGRLALRTRAKVPFAARRLRVTLARRGFTISSGTTRTLRLTPRRAQNRLLSTVPRARRVLAIAIVRTDAGKRLRVAKPLSVPGYSGIP